jgi:predicted transcriptional regulator
VIDLVSAHDAVSRPLRVGEGLADVRPILRFGSSAELSRPLGQKNLELLEVIFEHELEGIREAADLV